MSDILFAYAAKGLALRLAITPIGRGEIQAFPTKNAGFMHQRIAHENTRRRQ